jgi:hypothetical protein
MSKLALIPIPAERNGAALDVIFIHGLGTGATSTWVQAGAASLHDSFFLTTLAKDCPSAQIWAAEYSAERTKWSGRGMPLTRRAVGLLSYFDTFGIGQRPIVFVAHSLGSRPGRR